jgi:hypothetical protein
MFAMRQMMPGVASKGTAGATEQQIDILPTRVFSTDTLPSDPSEEHTDCMVCLLEFEDGCVLRTLPCMHSFHRDCIDTYVVGVGVWVWVRVSPAVGIFC